jgi:hypothetical protein
MRTTNPISLCHKDYSIYMGLNSLLLNRMKYLISELELKHNIIQSIYINQEDEMKTYIKQLAMDSDLELRTSFLCDDNINFEIGNEIENNLLDSVKYYLSFCKFFDEQPVSWCHNLVI